MPIYRRPRPITTAAGVIARAPAATITTMPKKPPHPCPHCADLAAEVDRLNAVVDILAEVLATCSEEQLKLTAALIRAARRRRPGPQPTFARSVGHGVRRRQEPDPPSYPRLFEECRRLFPGEYKARNVLERGLEFETWRRAVIRRLRR